MQTSARLSIIVPCYHPSPEWGAAFAAKFQAVQAELSKVVGSLHLTLVNDGYPDGIRPAVLDTVQQLLPEIQLETYEINRGKGYALRTGVAATEADLYLITDADFPYTIESMLAIVASLQERGGIAAGNRDLDYYDNVPAFRRLLSQGLRWMLRNLLRLQVTDSQCGLKGFDQAGKAIFLETTIDRFLFDLEFLLLARKRVEVIPVPVELREGVVFSKVGLRIIATEGLNFLKLFLRFK